MTWGRGVLAKCCRPRLKPVEARRDGRAPFIGQGIAVRLPLAGEMGEPGDRLVAEQAAQPVVASHPGRPGQQAVRRGVAAAALAVGGEGDQVQRAAAEPDRLQ